MFAPAESPAVCVSMAVELLLKQHIRTSPSAQRLRFVFSASPRTSEISSRQGCRPRRGAPKFGHELDERLDEVHDSTSTTPARRELMNAAATCILCRGSCSSSNLDSCTDRAEPGAGDVHVAERGRKHAILCSATSRPSSRAARRRTSCCAPPITASWSWPSGQASELL